MGQLGSGPRLVSRIGSGPRLVGRVGSGVRISDSFHILSCAVVSAVARSGFRDTQKCLVKHHIRLYMQYLSPDILCTINALTQL